MAQPKASARRDYMAMLYDIPTKVAIQGTNKTVGIRGIKPYTLECLTRLWIEREESAPDNAEDTLKSLCSEPYFAVKQACLFVLNGYWRIKILYPFMWRLWGKLRGYTEEQMLPIIMEGKKKLPLTAHWKVMAFSVDMRTDWMKMTSKEAEQYRAELLSAVSQPSSKSSQNTDGQNGE